MAPDLAIQAAIPISDGTNPSLWIDSLAPPSGSVEIRLPPLGDVLVRVVGPDEKLVTSPVVVEYETQWGGGEFQDLESDVTSVVTTTTGEVVLASAQRDGAVYRRDVDVHVLDGAWVLANALEEKHRRFGAFARDGFADVITVHLAPARATVRVRIVDEAGHPFANEELSTLFEGPGSIGEFSRCRTDGEGVATIGVPGVFIVDSQERPVSAKSLRLRPIREADSWRFAWVDLAAMSPAQVRDLGTRTVSRRSVLVAGTVVDAAGEPLAGVAVWTSRDGKVENLLREHAPDLMLNSFFGDVRTGSEGSFTIPTEDWEEGRHLSANLDGYPITVVPFVAGDRAVKIVLHRPGKLVGWFRSPKSLEGKLVIRDVRTGRDELTWMFATQETSSQDLCTLAPGQYEFLLQLLIEGAPKVSIGTFTIREGETLAPPELNPFDITALVRRIRVSVHLPDGRPAAGARVEIGKASWLAEHDMPIVGADGVCDAWILRDAAEIRVVHAGWRTAYVPAPAAAVDVTLRPAIPLSIALEPFDRLSRFGRRVLLRVIACPEPAHPWDRDPFHHECALSASGALAVPVPEPCALRAVVVVRCRDDDQSFVISPAAQIAVGHGPTSTTLRVDADELDVLESQITRARTARHLPPER